MCVSPHALLSALLLRAKSGGAAPSREELIALLGAGCAREDVRRALAGMPRELAILDGIGDDEVTRRRR
jgi:hypothetical protein